MSFEARAECCLPSRRPVAHSGLDYEYHAFILVQQDHKIQPNGSQKCSILRVLLLARSGKGSVRTLELPTISLRMRSLKGASGLLFG